MGAEVGSGYTLTLLLPSLVTIPNFAGLPCSILIEHKGDNNKDLTPGASQLP